MKKILALFAVLILLCGCGAEAPMISEESFFEEEQKIFPVLYYEDIDISMGDMLSTSVHTYTYRIEGQNARELEKHSRTWAETYPLSATNAEMCEKYGQLMKYYNTKEYEIFVFCKVLPEQNGYTVIINGCETELVLEQNENFVDFLFSDGGFYFIALDNMNPLIYVYRFSTEASVEDTFTVSYRGMGISETDIDYHAFAATENAFAVPVRKNGKQGILMHRIKSDETDYLPLECELFGIAAEDDAFKVAGYNKVGNIVVFDIFASGEIKNGIETPHPSGLKLSSKNINTPGKFYMYDSEIYLNFRTEGGCLIASFDMKTNEWTNYLEVEPIEELRGPLKVKYMTKSGDEYYDIFPNISNAE